MSKKDKPETPAPGTDKPEHPDKPEKPDPNPKKETLTVIVNGTPTEVEANLHAPLATVVDKALERTGNSGQPAENWELRDAAGAALDMQKKIGEFNFSADVKLFLSLKAGVGG